MHLCVKSDLSLIAAAAFSENLAERAELDVNERDWRKSWKDTVRLATANDPDAELNQRMRGPPVQLLPFVNPSFVLRRITVLYVAFLCSI